MKELMLAAALLVGAPSSTVDPVHWEQARATQYQTDNDNPVVISMTVQNTQSTVLFGCYPLIPVTP